MEIKGKVRNLNRFGAFVDVGIDTGDIIAQTMYPIGPVDDYRKVLQTAYEGCARKHHSLFLES